MSEVFNFRQARIVADVYFLKSFKISFYQIIKQIFQEILIITVSISSIFAF